MNCFGEILTIIFIVKLACLYSNLYIDIHILIFKLNYVLYTYSLWYEKVKYLFRSDSIYVFQSSTLNLNKLKLLLCILVALCLLLIFQIFSKSSYPISTKRGINVIYGMSSAIVIQMVNMHQHGVKFYSNLWAGILL